MRLILEQIKRTNGKLRAYTTVCEESAVKLAEAAETQLRSGHDLGPLHGIPVSVKDLYETEGIRTTCSSKLMRDYVPKTDSTVVRRLKEAGGIVVGKTNTHEFALGYTSPPTRNPWNLNYVPGGSSGGSGAAIAATSAIASTGSDTGGSIRVPSAFCGVVGIKPTYGRVSRAGIFPESWSLDHAGPITKRVEDSALMLRIMAGRDELDQTSSHAPVPDYVAELKQGVRGLRIGVPKNFFFDQCHEAVQAAVRVAIDVLKGLGCSTTEFEFPHPSEIIAAATALDFCESSAGHESDIQQRAEEFQPDVRLLLEAGLFIPATYYIQAQRFRGMAFREVMDVLRGFHVMITPTQPMVAPKVDQRTVSFGSVEESLDSAASRFMYPFNLTGLPALSIPCGYSEGLPIGMQIIGKAYDEATVLRIGQAYEQATDWHRKTPDIS